MAGHGGDVSMVVVVAEGTLKGYIKKNTDGVY